MLIDRIKDALALIAGHIRTHADRLDVVDSALANQVTPADITAAVNALINGAPGALNTLQELAAALQDNDSELATLVSQVAAVNAALAGKLAKSAKAVDSAKLNGATENANTAGNTIVKRTSAGDVNGRYFLGSYTRSNHGTGTRSSDTQFISGTSDRYQRWNNKTGMRASLDVYSKAEVNSVAAASGGVSDVRLGGQGQLGSPTYGGSAYAPAGHVFTGFNYYVDWEWSGSNYISRFYYKPIQKRVNGTWMTVSG